MAATGGVKMGRSVFDVQIAVVTGAASGIGREIALMLKSKGAKAVIGLDKDAAGLADLTQVSGSHGIVCDVTNRAQVVAAIAEIKAAYGTVDILVIAAGILQPPPLTLEAVSERQFDRIIDVNLKGAWNILSLVGKEMAANGSGSIVTIASITGLSAGPLVPYGPAKAALIEMTKSFAGAWGKSGVRVNCVAPGFVETPGLKRGTEFGIIDVERLTSATALNRLPTTREIAEAVCFFASGYASAITGTVLPVDCGALTMHGFAALDRQG
jgi:NAD(P)-dependent dehydrogenase (short-subunit alcohol dehydrogenase family)